MKRSFDGILFQAKAVLCLVLTLNLSIWTLGCGQAGFSLFGEITVPLTPDHQLTALLKGSDFEGATAVVVNPSTHQFRLTFPDGQRDISGSYALSNGQPELTTLTLTTATKSATIQVDSSKHVTQIASNQGSAWDRPGEWNTQGSTAATAPTAPAAPRAPVAPSAARTVSPGADAYLQANAQLLELARQVDQQNGTGDDSAKTEQSSLFWVPAALLAFVFVPAGIVATLIFVFELIVIINVIL